MFRYFSRPTDHRTNYRKYRRCFFL